MSLSMILLYVGIALLTACVYVVSVAYADLICWLADRGDEPGDRGVW